MNFLLRLLFKCFLSFLSMVLAFVQSEAMAAFPATTPLLKWNPADGTGIAGYTTTAEAACVKSIPYWVGQGYGPTGSVYDHVNPRPGYEAVQQQCWAIAPSGGAPYWISVLQLMGSCDGGATYNAGMLSCPTPCPPDSKQIGGSCVCKDGFDDAPNNKSCAILEENNAAQAPPACNDPRFGNPIYPLTGSKVEPVATGIEIGGIALSLSYDSASKASGSISSAYGHLASFGELWFTNLHRKLVVAPTLKTAMLSRGNGRILSFAGTGSGVFSAAANRSETLTAIAGGYRLTDPGSGTQEIYDSTGKLTSLVTAQGKVLSFSYIAQDLASIQDNDGRVIRFAYASAGIVRRITKVTDTIGQAINAAYGTTGNLVSLTWQDGKIRQFLYENTSFPWALTGVTDENNTRYATFGYDTQGRAISTEHAGGVNHFSVSYTQPPSVSVASSYNAGTNVLSRTRSWQMPVGPVITTPNGAIAAMGVQNRFGMPALTGMSQPAGSGCAAASNAMSYDASGNMASKDDFNGQRSCYAYDSKNQPVTVVEGLINTSSCAAVLTTSANLPANSRKLSTQWHPDWRLASREAQPSKLITNVYNGQPDPFNGNAIASCAPAAAKTPDGKPIAVLCKQVEAATTDADGHLGLAAAVDVGVPSRVSSFTYDAAGRTLTSTDPLSRVTTYAYYGTSTDFTDHSVSPDASFASVSLLLHGDDADASTVMSDSGPVPKTIVTGGDARVSTAQSKFGGSSIHFDGVRDYLSPPSDASLSMGASDFTIEMWIYKLANNPNTSRIWNPDGVVDISIGIDTVGNLVSYGSTTGTSWSAWMFPTGILIPNGVWKHMALVRSGGTVTLYVDGIGTVITTTLGTASLHTTGTNAHVIGGQGTSADRAFNGYIDEVRITKGVARYTANFTPATQAFLNNDPVLKPNATGHRVGDLQSIANAAGHVTLFTLYDGAGRVRQMVDPKGVVTDTVYTPRGWVASTTVTPPGGVARTTSYSYDNAGQLTGVVLPDTTTLAYSYDAAHRLIGVTDTKGDTVTYTLDNMGNRVSEQVKDPQGNLQRNITWVYDALNRVQPTTGAAN